MPHPTTLMKITTRCGEQAVNGLNEALLARAVEARVLKTNRVRADTTVVPANVAYPSDSSLLAKGVAKMVKNAKKLKAMGFATRTAMADKTRTVRSRARSINANLRRRTDDKLAEVRRINLDLAGIAERVAAAGRRGGAQRAPHAARRRCPGVGPDSCGDRRVGTDRRVDPQVAAQTRQRLAGDDTGRGDPGGVAARRRCPPDRQGPLGKPVEFGYKAQLVDNEDGVIVDHNIEAGNPPDAPMLAPAIRRIKKRTGRAPRAVTADRGYGEHGVENDLRDAGVRYVVLPTKGRPNAARRVVENRRAFRKMVRWRTGCEGRISCAKRDFGLNRTRIDGLAGARTWCGHGIFAHNLVKISGLVE